MKKIAILRKGIPFLLSAVLLAGFTILFSAATVKAKEGAPLITYLSNPVLNSSQQHYAEVLINDRYTKAHWYISVNFTAFTSPRLSVLLPTGKTIEVLQTDLEHGFGNTTSWFGKYDAGTGDAVFTIHNNMLTARMGGLKEQYMIYPLKDGIHILLELNSSAFPNDETPEGYKDMIEKGEKYNGKEDQNRIDPETGEEALHLAGNCKVRVLVAYTDDVDAALADPLGFSKSCIDATNTAFNNSAVNFDVEMACALETSYAESGNSVTDKTRFRDTGDGFMDEVHDWRTYYDADLCHLLVNSLSNGCGEAWAVSISVYADAFCVTDRTCAVGNNTFPHELGHLYGARHDTYVDNTNTPYAYGHGYIYHPGQWRTIMSYDDECADNGYNCTRISYFSNPGISFNGNATGVTNASDNESAHEASRTAIAGLETSLVDKIFPAWTHEIGEHGDVLATNSVSNLAGYVMNSGSEVSWRATNYHVMVPGFWAKAGSKFQTLFDDCTPILAREPEPAVASILEKNKIPVPGNIIAIPNPFVDEVDIRINLPEDKNVTLFVSDISGREIKSIVSGKDFTSGIINFKVNLSDLKSGVYLLNFSDGVTLKVLKIVKPN